VKKTENSLISTNTTIVLSFLAENPAKDYATIEIKNATGMSRQGVYLALIELEKEGLVSKTKKGKMLIYHVNYENNTVKQFKVLKMVISLQTLVENLSKVTDKIILYGSAARGEDRADSDIDLFIQTENAEDAIDELKKFRSNRKIQEKIMGAVGLSKMKDEDRVFYDEVMRGVVLWEKK
jgi:predicted nucleotidyltransferase